jgi:ATP-dependent RNA helicase DDX31/DBP7
VGPDAADAAAASLPPLARGGDGADSSDGGDYGGRPVTTFMDETRAFKPAKRRREAPAGEDAAPAPRAEAPKQPKRGELVRAGAAPAPGGASFAALGLDAKLAAHLASLGFAAPTPVQTATIPPLLARRDALVRAPTGSGKTLAYAAPIVQLLAGPVGGVRAPRSVGTRALILLPTRELVLQTGDVLSALTRHYHWVVGGVLYGGEARGSEKARLRKGVAALAATPGRLIDHLQNTASFVTTSLEWLVLDEADRLLDLGFESKVAEILASVAARNTAAPPPAHPPPRRATVLLSATMSARVATLGGVALVDPVRVGELGAAGGGVAASAPGAGAARARGDRAAAASAAAGAASIPESITHASLTVPARAKVAALAALILSRTARGGRVLAFFSSCDGVDAAHALLTRGLASVRDDGQGLLPPGAPLLRLHGGMPQAERSASFLAFSRASSAALLATDVAARGLDFPGLAAAVQVDAAGDVADYCHRAGRAGRAGAAGEAILILLPSETGYLKHLADAGVPPLRPLDPMAELGSLLSLPLRPPPGLGHAARHPDEHTGARALGAALLHATSRDADLRAAAEAGFRACVRAYATFPASLKPVFHPKRLHLGHVAHAFGLRDAPSVFGGRQAGDKGGGKKKKQRG